MAKRVCLVLWKRGRRRRRRPRLLRKFVPDLEMKREGSSQKKLSRREKEEEEREEGSPGRNLAPLTQSQALATAPCVVKGAFAMLNYV